MSFREVSTEDLQALRRRVHAGLVECPLDPELPSLIAWHQRGSSIFGHSKEATLALLDAVLAERSQPRSVVELVWTGPESVSSQARDTAAVVHELFTMAHRSVLIAGYSFDHGEQILLPLHEAIRDRGVHAELFLDVKRAASSADAEAHTVRELELFRQNNWPFAGPMPGIYYDPRTIWGDEYASLHAKCIVVDERWSLIGSANFTDRGQTRNIEVGAKVDDVSFARRLVHQWRQAVHAGVFTRAL